MFTSHLFTIVTMPTTTTGTTASTTTTANTHVDMATVANDHLELQTNATPSENLIAGIGGHETNAQPHPQINLQDAAMPTLPPPPHVSKPHHYNITNATLPAATRSPRASPTPVINSPRAPRGISPVTNTADSNNNNEDLMSFESVSSQLIATANQNPFPTHKPYPANMIANEIPPLSAANQSHVHSSAQASLLHSHVNANTANSNPPTTDDLIVLDTLKATEITKMKQESMKNLIGPFEQDMIIVDRNDSSSDKSYPHHGGVTSTNRSTAVTGATTNQLAPANTNAHWMSQSFPQQHHNNTPHKSSNQNQASHLSYRDGFGVTQSDVLCVEAMQMWVKAEKSLAHGDKAVGLLAYQRVSGEHY